MLPGSKLVDHIGGPTREAVTSRSVVVSNTSESSGEKPMLTASPAPCAAIQNLLLRRK
jgi:hypothetical protein